MWTRGTHHLTAWCTCHARALGTLHPGLRTHRAASSLQEPTHPHTKGLELSWRVGWGRIPTAQMLLAPLYLAAGVPPLQAPIYKFPPSHYMRKECSLLRTQRKRGEQTAPRAPVAPEGVSTHVQKNARRTLRWCPLTFPSAPPLCSPASQPCPSSTPTSDQGQASYLHSAPTLCPRRRGPVSVVTPLPQDLATVTGCSPTADMCTMEALRRQEPWLPTSPKDGNTSSSCRHTCFPAHNMPRTCTSCRAALPQHLCTLATHSHLGPGPWKF